MRILARASLRKPLLLGPLMLALLAVLAMPGVSLAQQDEWEEELALPSDPCATRPCRELSREERAAFGRVLSGLIAALPQPSKAVYEQIGLKSIQGLGSALVTDEARQSPSFPENVVDPMGLATGEGVFPRSLALAFSYVRKDGRDVGARFHRTGSAEMEVFDLRIEISGQAGTVLVRPSPTARVIDSTASSFAWEESLPAEEEAMVNVTAVFGDYARERTSSVDESAQAEKLAPLRAIRVSIQGPSSEARDLLKRLDKKSLKALVVPRARKHGAARNKGVQ